MSHETLTLALVTEVFPGPSDWSRLAAVASKARDRGAELVVLPEIPLNPWSPASKEQRDEDAEEQLRHAIRQDADNDYRGEAESVVRSTQRAPSP